jgi:hypothetical protein
MIANTPGFGSADVASWSKFAVRTLLSKIPPVIYPDMPLLTVGSGYDPILM